MNRIFLLVLSLVAVVACAQNTSKDYEKDHVRLTLNDGKIIEGYIQKYWIDGKLFKRMNTTFVMSPLADGKIVVGKCDVEENDDLAMEFGIRNIPTILFIKDGVVVDKHVGASTKSKLQEKFDKLV